MLADTKSTAGRLKSKPMMEVYVSLIDTSIASGDYEVAREIIQSLLGKGNIPSKIIYQTIFEKMGLMVSKGLVSRITYSENGMVKPGGPTGDDIEKFKFLLFLVDALTDRKLPCEAPLYATIVSFGIHLGGLPRKIAALMNSARTSSGTYADRNKLIDEEEQCESTSCMVSGWQEVFSSYDKLRHQIDGPSTLPKLQVRVSKKDVPRVLRAEKNLSFRKRREV
jgi:(2Fe-2S) ferredoxin